MPPRQDRGHYGTWVGAGGLQLPSVIDGAFSSGQYMRSVMLKSPSAAGSQLPSLSLPGDSCCTNRSIEPSAFFFSGIQLLRA